MFVNMIFFDIGPIYINIVIIAFYWGNISIIRIRDRYDGNQGFSNIVIAIRYRLVIGSLFCVWDKFGKVLTKLD